MSLEHSPARQGARNGQKNQAEDPVGRWLTRKEICAALGISEMTLWRMVTEGRIEAPVKINSRNVRFRPGVLERFAERNGSPEYAGIARDPRK